MSLRKSPAFVREGVIGLLGVMSTALGFWVWGWWGQPYGEVNILDVVREGSGVRISANFVKYEISDAEDGWCRLLEFVPYGIVAGRPIPLPHVDLHGREDNDSREAGFQALDIVVDFGQWRPEAVEMRTVHNCRTEDDPRIVTRVFATVPVPNK